MVFCPFLPFPYFPLIADSETDKQLSISCGLGILLYSSEILLFSYKTPNQLQIELGALDPLSVNWFKHLRAGLGLPKAHFSSPTVGAASVSPIPCQAAPLTLPHLNCKIAFLKYQLGLQIVVTNLQLCQPTASPNTLSGHNRQPRSSSLQISPALVAISAKSDCLPHKLNHNKPRILFITPGWDPLFRPARLEDRAPFNHVLAKLRNLRSAEGQEQALNAGDVEELTQFICSSLNLLPQRHPWHSSQQFLRSILFSIMWV